MTTPLTARREARERQKREYHAYREAAKASGLEIPDHANVQTVEGGAYVEAHVFIPAEAMKRHLEES